MVRFQHVPQRGAGHADIRLTGTAIDDLVWLPNVRFGRLGPSSTPPAQFHGSEGELLVRDGPNYGGRTHAQRDEHDPGREPTHQAPPT
jgi:hypothetical protein